MGFFNEQRGFLRITTYIYAKYALFFKNIFLDIDEHIV